MSKQEDYIGEEPKIPGKGVSIWLDTTPATEYPILSEELEADVVIIGGGLVGLLSAFVLVHAGKNVVVLENRKIGSDVTGHTTAKITSQHGLIYSKINNNYGLEAARTYGKAQQTAIDFYKTIINEHLIKCGFEEKDAYIYTEDYGLREKLIKEVEICEKLELPVEYVRNLELPFDTIGAEKFKGQYQFHPREFLIEIAKIITKKGGKIFENSRAIKIEDGDICEVDTEKGKVFAKKMIIASNFPVLDTGSYYQRLVPNRSYALAGTINGNLPEGMYYELENGNKYFSFRTQRVGIEKVVLFGMGRHVAGRDHYLERYKELSQKAKKKFDVKSFEWHWSTQDNFTFDGMPYIGQSPGTKNTYVATGFGGWGMTNSAVSALLISNLILGREDKGVKIFDPKRFKTKYSLRLAKAGADTAYHLLKDRFTGKKFQFLPEIKEGEGAVVEYQKKKLAIYKDKEGKLHQFSNHCTHMGCGLHWNEAEKTWDCHCHGSRFDSMGKVIHGPAKKDLKEETPE